MIWINFSVPLRNQKLQENKRLEFFYNKPSFVRSRLRNLFNPATINSGIINIYIYIFYILELSTI